MADIVRCVTDDQLEMRPFTAEEMDQAHALISLAFGGAGDPEDRDAEASVFEFDRSLAMFDGGRMVSTMGTYTFDTTVPGGSMPMGGTTWVTVSPTHRRRGILRRMMTRHLADILERGEPLAGLWASEPAIYGRFGYGHAIEQQRAVISTEGDVRWRPTAPPAAPVRLIGLDEAPPLIGPIYEAARRRRAGSHGRTQQWWDFSLLSTRRSAMAGMRTKYCAVAEVDGTPAAYAVYGLRGDFGNDGRPAGSMHVFETVGVDPAAEAAMWRFLLAHDLVTTVTAPHQPYDSVLPLLLADSRRVVRKPGDALHVRVMDVPAALQGRGYLASAGFTVEIVDDMVEANDGTWQVEVAPEGALVTPSSTTTPDVRMPVETLGAMFMGDVPLGRLVAAGMAEAGDTRLVHEVDVAFASIEKGWVPEIW